MSSQATVKGVDIYHGDGPIDMHQLASDGVQFVIMKASEGIANSDPAFTTNWANAKSAGLIRGAYHFFNADGDGTAQANRFLNLVPLMAGDLRVTLDIETYADGLVSRVNNAIAVIKSRTGWYPFLYTSLSFYKEHLNAVTTCPLWIAEYGVSAPRTAQQPVIWQYSESEHLSGIAHVLDADTFFGTIEQLHAQCYPSIPAGH